MGPPPEVRLLLVLLACTEDTEADAKTEEERTGPLAVSGWTEHGNIAEGDADSQGEPSVVALPDGTVIAAWMSLDGYSLYVRYAISKDGGLTWSDADYIDKDRYGYQNDPVLVYGGGYVYFTWLAVEGSNYDKSAIYCVDSTDGGETWSDPVELTENNSFNDRQWMATDASGRAVITWDLFESDYLMTQVYAESAGGCAGFGEHNGTDVFDGIFLNGVPAIDAAGNVWISRHQLSYSGADFVVQKVEPDGSLGDEVTLHEGSYAFAQARRHVPVDPEYPPGARERMIGHELEELHTPPWKRGIFAPDGLGIRKDEPRDGEEAPWEREQEDDRPMAAVSGSYSGTYSPVLMPTADGGLAVVGLDLAEGTDDEAEVWFVKYDGAEGITEFPLVEGATGYAQQEPWMTVDPDGGLHVIWYDAREGRWRLRGATSLDHGATWTEFDIGENTMKKGFSDNDIYSWVGHFQGVSAWEGGVVAVYGDSSEDETSWIKAATAKVE